MDRENQQSVRDPYFNNKRIRQYLIQSGLINRRGDILPPAFDEVVLAQRKKSKYTKARSVHAITTYVIEGERPHQMFVRSEFDLDMRRSREPKRPQHRSMSNSFTHMDTNRRERNTRTLTSISPKRSARRAKSVHHSPVNAKNQLVRRSTTAKQLLDDEYCEVTMIYYGPQLSLDHNNSYYQPNGDEIVVMQQHCGGENLMVYKGFVKPHEIFTFESRRRPDYPFALALYINNFVDSRISVCCEYKHKPNVRLGCKSGLFGIYDVQKSKPCRLCRCEKRRKKKLTDTSNRSPERKSIPSRSTSTNPTLHRALSASSKKKQEPSKSEKNPISAGAQTSGSSRALRSASLHHKNRTDKYQHNNSLVTFDDKFKKSDQPPTDGRKNNHEKLIRITSGTGRQSRPSTPIISSQYDTPYYSSQSLLTARYDDDHDDDKPSDILRMSRPSPVCLSENEDDRHLLKLTTKTPNNNEHLSTSSSSISVKKPDVSAQSMLAKDKNEQSGGLSSNTSKTSSSTSIPIFQDDDDSTTTRQRTSSSSSSSSDCSLKKEDESRLSNILTQKNTIGRETSRSSFNILKAPNSSFTKKEHSRSSSSCSSTTSFEQSDNSKHCVVDELERRRSSISSTDIQQKNGTHPTSSDDDVTLNATSEHTGRNEDKKPITTHFEKPPEKPYCPVENIILVWLDTTFDTPNSDTNNSEVQLRELSRPLHTFSDPKKCIQWINEIKTEKIFLIIPGPLSESVLQQIGTHPQLATVYIFCQDYTQYEYLSASYPKIQGVYTDIRGICKRIKIDLKQVNNDLNMFQTVSSIDSNQFNSQHLLFIQNQLFKEYLLETDASHDAVHHLIDYCRHLYSGNEKELELIQQFEENYNSHDALYWYTKDCFAYHMLHRAIRMKDMKILSPMRFFIRDINHQLKETRSTVVHRSTLTVFHGQGMKAEAFEELKQNRGGLVSFNEFLSTHVQQAIPYEFAKRSLSYGFPVAVLFHMTIDPTKSSIPFASLQNRSAHRFNQEILFSLQTIFQIDAISSIENNLWQVDLTLINEQDHKLHEYIQIERHKYTHLIKDEKIGQLLMDMNELHAAKDLYEMSLPGIADPKYTYIYSQIAMIYGQLEEYDQAIVYYNLSLQTKSMETLHDYGTLACIHNNIAELFYKQNKVREALDNCQHALHIQSKHLPTTHPSVINTYDLLAVIYEDNDDYQMALEYYQKQLDIQEKISSMDRSDLAATHFKIAICLANLDRLDEAIDHAQQSIDMSSPNDPELSNRHAVLEKIREQLE